jgi:hypothetical protein
MTRIFEKSAIATAFAAAIAVSTLTVPAFAGSAAAGDQVKKAQNALDMITTQAITSDDTACTEASSLFARNASCPKSERPQSSRYPVNALEGMNLGF